ncbi:MAG: tRNA pseudouridine(38-40) synthase TruA [Clostridia bacterium]|nr:tRNA pseudouridine(38-40) synthase TruA [Clostridia bacterium]
MKILLTIEYKGTDFAGWQSQPNKRTIQGEIESALFSLLGEKIQIYGSGRTDSGVHALAQTAHFEVGNPLFEKKFNKKGESLTQFILALNSNLPADIKILKAKKVASNFHSRYDVKEKVYLYKMETNTRKTSPLLNGFVGTSKYDLEIEKMKEGSKFLIGEHDFTSFSSSNTEIKDFVRTINYIKIKKENENVVTFEISGNGFLYNMVRIIIGTLVQVGTYKIEPKELKTILESKDRTKAGKTAQACGLYLKKVRY